MGGVGKIVLTRTCPTKDCREMLRKDDPLMPWTCPRCGWRSDETRCLTCGRGGKSDRDS